MGFSPYIEVAEIGGLLAPEGMFSFKLAHYRLHGHIELSWSLSMMLRTLSPHAATLPKKSSLVLQMISSLRRTINLGNIKTALRTVAPHPSRFPGSPP
jgi:hypothetical protein